MGVEVMGRNVLLGWRNFWHMDDSVKLVGGGRGEEGGGGAESYDFTPQTLWRYLVALCDLRTMAASVT